KPVYMVGDVPTLADSPGCFILGLVTANAGCRRGAIADMCFRRDIPVIRGIVLNRCNVSITPVCMRRDPDCIIIRQWNIHRALDPKSVVVADSVGCFGFELLQLWFGCFNVDAADRRITSEQG